MNIRLVFGLLILVLIFSSCGKREKRIDRILRKSIDTTTAKQTVILRDQLDSLCDAQFDSLVQIAVDSIIKERELEIQKIVKHER